MPFQDMVNGALESIKSTASEFLSGESPDPRCILAPRDRSNDKVVDRVFGPNSSSNPMYPLRKSKRLLFPNTPTVTFGGTAEYEDYGIAHTNYKYPAFTRSYPSEIVITAEITAATPFEASFMLAVLRFCQSSIKTDFGVRAGTDAGTPPPVLNFSYLGKQMFDKVPVVVKNFQMNFDPEIDYVDVPKFKTKVPAHTTITLTLETFQNPKDLRDNFSLSDFKAGKTIGKGYI